MSSKIHNGSLQDTDSLVLQYQGIRYYNADEYAIKPSGAPFTNMDKHGQVINAD